MQVTNTILLMLMLSGAIFGVGVANAQLATYPLAVSLSNTYQTVPVGSVCTSGGCTTASQASITACMSGGSPPYSVIVNRNGNRDAAGATQSCYTYQFTPSALGTYNIQFMVTDNIGNTATSSAVVVATSQGGQYPPSASVSPQTMDVAVGAQTPITLTINGGVPPYTIGVTNNGAAATSTVTSASSYIYSFTPPVTGDYVIEFSITDASGATTTQTSEIFASPGGSTVIGNGGSSSTLSVAVSPTYKSVAAGTPVLITATASGGNTAGYDIFLYDTSGHIVAQAQGGTLSYTYVPASLGEYYGFTVAAYDASGALATQVMYIQTTGSSSYQSSPLSISVSPPSTVNSGSSASFVITATGGVPASGGNYYLVIKDQNNDVIGAINIPASSPYTYSIPTSLAGSYAYNFEVTDSLGSTATTTATLNVAGGSGGSSSGGSTGGGGTTSTGSILSLTLTPPSGSTEPSGVAVPITASVSGGNSAGYDIFLYDTSGNIVAKGQGSTLSYTFTPQAGQYYGFTAAAYDASGNIATKVTSITGASG